MSKSSKVMYTGESGKTLLRSAANTESERLRKGWRSFTLNVFLRYKGRNCLIFSGK